MSVENDYQLFSAFLFSLLFLIFFPSLLYFPLLSRRQGDGVKDRARRWTKEKEENGKKEKQRKVNIHFLHSLLHFTVFSFFFHFPLTLLPPSLSRFSLSHFPTLLWNPIHRFFPFHSLNLFFLQSESLGFLLSLSHFHYNSSERFSANPKAFLLKKRD